MRVRSPRGKRLAGQVVLAAAYLVAADRLLERERKPGANRLDDRWGTALLPDRRHRMVGVPRRTDEQDGPAAWYRRDAVAQQRALDDEHPRRPGAADELVRR